MENELLENSNFIMYTTDDGQVEMIRRWKCMAYTKIYGRII